MTVVVVDVCVGGDFYAHCHERFYNIEFHLQQFLVGIVLVVDGQSVVATRLQLTTVVGNGQLIVRIEYGGVDRVLIVFYLPVVEALQPVALKDILRHAPVSLTMVEVTGQTVVVM